LILEALFTLISAILLLYSVRHIIFTIVALHRSKTPKENVCEDYQPSVTVLIPARNEEKVIGRILKRMSELTYPKEKLQIIVINDGSKDKTGEIAEKFSEKHDNIEVIHRSPLKGGKGKASALNEGIKHAKGDIIICFDADYYPQVDIIEKLVAPLADEKVAAVQGRIVVINEPENLITRLVALERVGGYCIGQKARENLGLISQFGGTAGGFKRKIVEELGGLSEDILAEDTDLTFKLFLAGYRVCYVNEAESYEEAVNSFNSYWRQRLRWAIGHMQCALKHLIPVIKSRKLSLKQKIDAIFLLNVYFVPILMAIAWIIGGILVFNGPSIFDIALWSPIPFLTYASVGNFAPFFEIGMGMYADRRAKACKILPLLFPMFLYNVVICTFALIKLCVCKLLGRKIGWDKTPHHGRETVITEKYK